MTTATESAAKHSSDVVWADTPEQLAMWDNLVESHPAGSAYLLSWYLAFQNLPRTRVEIALIQEGGVAVAGAVLYTFTLPGITVCVVPSSPIARSGSESRLEVVVRGLIDRARSKEASLLQFEAFEAETRDVIRDLVPAAQRNDEAIWKLYHPSVWRELRVDLRGKTDESLLASFSTSTRQRVREGIKKKVEIQEVREPAALSEVHELWVRGGAQLGYTIRPHDSFAALVTETWRRDSGALLASRVDGKLAAFVFSIFHGTGSIYMYGAHDNELAKGYGNRILQYLMMCRALKRGAQWYSLGGPAEAGIREFKMGFRPVLVDNWRFVSVLLRPMRTGMFRALLRQSRWMQMAKSWAARAI